jgi:hypothetical protein
MKASMLPKWVFDLRDRIPALLQSYSAGPPGLYRLCTDGDLLPPGPRAGLGFSCYAAKITVQRGLWDKLTEDHRIAWIRHIQGFQLSPNPPHHGMFCDPWVEFHGRLRYTYFCMRNRRWKDILRVNWQNRWAETRQAVATLSAMGAKPLHPISGFPVKRNDILAFLNCLDWRMASGAGAQTGHLLFFLKHGKATAEQRSEGLQIILEFLTQLESAETGGWYRGKVPNQEIMNGAMKVTNGLYWWGLPVRYAEALSRSAVAQVNGPYDCAITNRLFVLHRLADQFGHPPVGVEQIVISSLKAIEQFLQPDGGLASTPSGALRGYYFAIVSRGRPVGDLHGLCLLSWAIALCAHLSGELESLGWRLVPP